MDLLSASVSSGKKTTCFAIFLHLTCGCVALSSGSSAREATTSMAPPPPPSPGSTPPTPPQLLLLFLQQPKPLLAASSHVTQTMALRGGESRLPSCLASCRPFCLTGQTQCAPLLHTRTPHRACLLPPPSLPTQTSQAGEDRTGKSWMTKGRIANQRLQN